jgi:AcrR family transcriptional regulator
MPKVVDHEARREEVLEATWRVMARSGLDGTNLRDIAAEAGYSTGVIAHYFRNKDDVVRSALRRVWRREAERIQDQTEGLEGVAALERTVAQVLPFGEERRLEMAVWMSFWSSAVADERLAAEQAAYYGQWRERLRRHFAEAVTRNEVASDLDTALEAARLAALVDGISIQAMFEPRRFSPRFVRGLVHEYLRRLGPAG